MTTPMSSLLDSLYRKDSAVTSLEKTAEDTLAAALRSEGQVSDNPYVEMSTQELAELALRLESAKETTETETPSEVGEVLEKAAADTIGGQVMAHALVHEFSLIKQAMAAGLCRVCKQNPMDIEGSSICTACSAS